MVLSSAAQAIKARSVKIGRGSSGSGSTSTSKSNVTTTNLKDVSSGVYTPQEIEILKERSLENASNLVKTAATGKRISENIREINRSEKIAKVLENKGEIEGANNVIARTNRIVNETNKLIENYQFMTGGFNPYTEIGRSYIENAGLGKLAANDPLVIRAIQQANRREQISPYKLDPQRAAIRQMAHRIKTDNIFSTGTRLYDSQAGQWAREAAYDVTLRPAINTIEEIRQKQKEIEQGKYKKREKYETPTASYESNYKRGMALKDMKTEYIDKTRPLDFYKIAPETSKAYLHYGSIALAPQMNLGKLEKLFKPQIAIPSLAAIQYSQEGKMEKALIQSATAYGILYGMISLAGKAGKISKKTNNEREYAMIDIEKNKLSPEEIGQMRRAIERYKKIIIQENKAKIEDGSISAKEATEGIVIETPYKIRATFEVKHNEKELIDTLERMQKRGVDIEGFNSREPPKTQILKEGREKELLEIGEIIKGDSFHIKKGRIIPGRDLSFTKEITPSLKEKIDALVKEGIISRPSLPGESDRGISQKGRKIEYTAEQKRDALKSFISGDSRSIQSDKDTLQRAERLIKAKTEVKEDVPEGTETEKDYSDFKPFKGKSDREVISGETLQRRTTNLEEEQQVFRKMYQKPERIDTQYQEEYPQYIVEGEVTTERPEWLKIDRKTIGTKIPITDKQKTRTYSLTAVKAKGKTKTEKEQITSQSQKIEQLQEQRQLQEQAQKSIQEQSQKQEIRQIAGQKPAQRQEIKQLTALTTVPKITPILITALKRAEREKTRIPLPDKEDEEEMTAYKPIIIDRNGNIIQISDPYFYEDNDSAAAKGMQLTDALPEHQFTILKTRIPQGSPIKRMNAYAFQSRFRKRGNTYVEKERWRKNFAAERGYRQLQKTQRMAFM